MGKSNKRKLKEAKIKRDIAHNELHEKIERIYDLEAECMGRRKVYKHVSSDR